MCSFTKAVASGVLQHLKKFQNNTFFVLKVLSEPTNNNLEQIDAVYNTKQDKECLYHTKYKCMCCKRCPRNTWIKHSDPRGKINRNYREIRQDLKIEMQEMLVTFEQCTC